MSSPRLRQQFDLLFKHFSGQNVEVQIEEITEVLSCTRRNARIVLSKLHELGWIVWQPSSGRGKLSSLVFKQSQDDVNIELAKQLLEEGKIGRALSVLDQDVHKLTQVVQDYIGLQHRHGQQIVRLPYYRPLTLSAPLYKLRRSEKNIIQQVASGLTTIDDTEQLAADIAHHWQSLTPRHWRFFIRPNIRCHNGNMLSMEQIVDHLKQLATIPLFAHIQDVEQTSDLIVDIHLSQSDYRLDQLLADASAKLVINWVDGEDGQKYPQGTGPFKIVHNDNHRVVLSAFDDYFGFRPLIDQVEVVVIDEVYSNLVYPSLSQNELKPGAQPKQEQVNLDPGCTYMLLDHVNGLSKQPQWASYFASKLNSLALLAKLPQQKMIDLGLISSFGLKPGWQHSGASGVTQSPDPETIVVAYQHDHTFFADIAKSIKSLLTSDGHNVELKAIEEIQENQLHADIWIKAMGIAMHKQEALATWFLCEELFEKTAKASVHLEVCNLIREWQSDPNRAFPGLEISHTLVASQHILPMFHCWLGVNQDHSGSLQNAKTNALGWFDFSRVWLNPKMD